MNEQKPMKLDRSDDGRLLVHSIFHTIQGEGPFVGVPSVFVRLGGCNLQCPGCDTEYTEGSQKHPIFYILDVVRNRFHEYGTQKGLHAVASHERPLIVITGGEPFRQKIWPLIHSLTTQGFRVQIETNGTLFHVPDYDFEGWYRMIAYVSIVCSPKTGTIAPGLIPYLTALKYVARRGDIDICDGLPIHALDHPAAPRVARPPDKFNGLVYLQPMDMGDDRASWENLQDVIASCKKHGHILCLQTHKIIGEE